MSGWHRPLCDKAGRPEGISLNRERGSEHYRRWHWRVQFAILGSFTITIFEGLSCNPNPQGIR